MNLVIGVDIGADSRVCELLARAIGQFPVSTTAECRAFMKWLSEFTEAAVEATYAAVKETCPEAKTIDPGVMRAAIKGSVLELFHYAAALTKTWPSERGLRMTGLYILGQVADMPVLNNGPAARRAVNAPLLAAIVTRWGASRAFVEFVGARPGEGVVGAFAFRPLAGSCGRRTGSLHSSGYPT